MASACVNNIGMSPEKFPPGPFRSYGWLSPRISFGRESPSDDGVSKLGGGAKASSPVKNPPEGPDPEIYCGEFEFRLEDPVAMLPADELFSGGKLMPLQFSSVQAAVNDPTSTEDIRSPDRAKYIRGPEIIGADPYLFSPKAPRCSSRWRELLGLKKHQNSTATTNGNAKSESHKTPAFVSSNAPKSLKHFLHRSSKSLSSPSASDATLSLPLLRDSDCESVAISSRLSFSSSSSGHEHEDLPRLSLDSDKPNPNHPNQIISIHRTNPGRARVRTVKTREATKQRSAADQSRVGRSPMRRAAGESVTVASRGVSVDSPRMNSSGKIVFQSLERSSSSPSSFNGGPRLKHRGMERSYSANVRVTPVLNVPVCSLRGSSKSGSVFGFGQLFSGPAPQKKEGNGGVSGHNRGQHIHYSHHHSQSKNRTDRTA